MNIVVGGFYTIKDEFFEMINDPYLYRNHPNGGYRPHFLAIYDKDTDLYWMVPCTSVVKKYQRILSIYNSKLKNYKSEKELNYIKTQKLGFMLTDINGKHAAIVFSDMFPICRDFVDKEYTRNKKPVRLDDVLTMKVIKQATIVRNLLKNGYKFVSTQPNISRIEKICQSYIKKE